MTERMVQVPARFVEEVVSALDAATHIGKRSCRDGDHLHYANHDRLIAEAQAFVPGWGLSHFNNRPA